jgi:ribosome recycling factor
VRKLGEASKTSIRNVRQAAMKKAKGDPSKEDAKRTEKEVEAATTAATAKVTAAVEAKEKDLRQV